MGLGRPVHGHRVWAEVALIVAVATLVFTVDVALQRIPKGLSVVVCVVIAVALAGYGLVRRGPARVIALVVAVLFLVVSITLVFVEHDPSDDVLIAVGVVVVLAASRRAFRAHVSWPPAPRPAHPVLFYNPRSGGGKAGRLDLAEEARPARDRDTIRLNAAQAMRWTRYAERVTLTLSACRGTPSVLGFGSRSCG